MAYTIKNNLDELEKMLARASTKVVPIMKHSVYEGAKVVHSAVVNSLNSAIKGNGDPDNTKHLVDAFYYGKMEANANAVSVNVFFEDYDSQGKPQPLKANVLESGTSDGRVTATHFFSRAIRSSRGASVDKMSSEFSEYLNNTTK